MKYTKVAVVQAMPFLFETDKTIEKMWDLLVGIKAESPDMVLFPEAFLPGYPRGLTFGAVVGSRSQEGRELYARYYDNAITIGDFRFKELQKMVREINADLAIGVVVRDEKGGTL